MCTLTKTRLMMTALLALLASTAHAQIGTVMQLPVMQFFDSNGDPLASGTLTSYAATTTTPLATYSCSDLSVMCQNDNPLTLNSSGRAIIYLSAATYKFVLKDSSGSTIWTQDNVAANAPWNLSTLTGKVQYTAPTTLTLSSNAVTPTGNVHALDTSGGAQNLNTISTTNVSSGFVLYLTGNNPGANPVTIKDGAGNISMQGGDFALSSATRWIALVLRSSTWYEVARSSATLQVTNNALSQARCTLTTGTPVTTADVTAATTVYVSPYGGNRISLYNGTSWNIRSFSELSIALGSDAANTNYDIFAYEDGAEAVQIERLAWSSDTARATNLTLQDGILSKNGTTTRRYVCTYRTTGSAGQTEDSTVKRFVWNYYNRQLRRLTYASTTDSWSYNSQTWRQAAADTSAQVAVVLGWAEVPVDLKILAVTFGSASDDNNSVAVGVDSITVPSANSYWGRDNSTTEQRTLIAFLPAYYPTVGYHYFSWMERNGSTNASTYYGDNGSSSSTGVQSGIGGFIPG